LRDHPSMAIAQVSGFRICNGNLFAVPAGKERG
jgi:hypothetical protein